MECRGRRASIGSESRHRVPTSSVVIDVSPGASSFIVLHGGRGRVSLLAPPKFFSMSRRQPKEDEHAWVFDSLVDFLRGPLWNIPIMNFIEERSMTFEPDGNNQKAHKKVHDEYKDLVDTMLGNYMEDIGITPEQFEKVCTRSATQMKTKFHQLQFEQLWAADDFTMFERMMTRTNIELQLQALELLQHRHGVIPASFLPADHISEQERRILEEVTRRSLEDQRDGGAPLDGETSALERAIVSTPQTKQRLQAGRDREQELIRSTMKLSVSDAPSPAAPQLAADKISPEELKRRQEYLRQQRDRLLQMKRVERERMLAAEGEAKEARPKSSRAARSALAGKLDPKTMEMRKSLAQALRREVVNQK